MAEFLTRLQLYTCREHASDSISWRQNFLRIYGRYVNCERHNFLRKNCRRDTISGRQILIPVTPGWINFALKYRYRMRGYTWFDYTCSLLFIMAHGIAVSETVDVACFYCRWDFWKLRPLEKKLEEYKRNNVIELWKRDARSIEAATKNWQAHKTRASNWNIAVFMEDRPLSLKAEGYKEHIVSVFTQYQWIRWYFLANFKDI